MTEPKTIALQVAKCAAFLDTKAPGWAYRVPIGDVNVADVRKSPLAFVIGPNWDEVITSKSAVEMGVLLLTPYTSLVEAANRAWQRQIATRRVRYR